jgi:hypothetical protein
MITCKPYVIPYMLYRSKFSCIYAGRLIMLNVPPEGRWCKYTSCFNGEIKVRDKDMKLIKEWPEVEIHERNYFLSDSIDFLSY